jgi:hypothetical protein
LLQKEREEMSKEIEKLKSDNAKLIEALEFYAKPSNYGINKPSECTSIDPSDHDELFSQEIGITLRGGKRARQVLKEVKEG